MKYQRDLHISAPRSQVFDWHRQPSALKRLMPPWEPVEVIQQSGGIKNGGITVLKMKVGPFSLRWRAEHEGFIDGECFVDVQKSGPFTSWRHEHRFIKESPYSCLQSDIIHCQAPLPFMGGIIQRKLERLFQYRHNITQGDNELHFRLGHTEPLRVAITGASGMVGSQLALMLETLGHTVIRLNHGHHWDYKNKILNANTVDGVDVFVHLAGENIGSGRWTRAKKKRLWDSRVEGTKFLAKVLSELPEPPKAFISASAVGLYGSSCKGPLTEESLPGDDFLAKLCFAWEEAAKPLGEHCRLVVPRISMVLSQLGGGLSKMLLPFKMGAGGVIGDGKQMMSWIALDDLLGGLYSLIVNPLFEGPYNMAAPHPVTNYEFTKTLGRVLRRPTMFPMPAFAARLAFGEMADALLLGSQNVRPERLEKAKFPFRYPELEGALRHLLGK